MKNREDVELASLIEEGLRLQFERKRDELREQAFHQIIKVQEENKKSFDRKRKEATVYQVGDIVAIKRTQLGPGLKLKPKFLGPYNVVKCLRHGRYMVEKVGDGEGPVKTSTSADNMKPWRGFRDDVLDVDEDDLQSDTEESDREEADINDTA